MVIERSELPIEPDRTRDFEQAFGAVEHQLRGAPGCLGTRLSRGIESPSKYLLLIEWQSVEAHKAFTQAHNFTIFRDSIAPFFAGKPATEHFDPVGA
jgi:heme-degrading monooxygenase HmoA